MGRPRTLVRDYISHLAWERFRNTKGENEHLEYRDMAPDEEMKMDRWMKVRNIFRYNIKKHDCTSIFEILPLFSG